MDDKSVKGVLAIVWLLSPLVIPLLAYFLPRTYVTEATSRWFHWHLAASAAFGALWFTTLAILVPRVVLSFDIYGGFKGIVIMLVMTLLSGYVPGGLALAYANRSHADAGSVVRLKTKHFGHTITTFQVVDGPHAGLPFSCGWTTWRRLGAQPSMILRPGRFGFWWGELLFEDEQASRR